MKHSIIGKGFRILLLAVLSMMMMAVAASADPVAGWSASGDKIYYYMETQTGLVKAVGLQKIGKYYYSFTPEGELQTGWVVTDEGYRYFRTTGAKGKRGRMYKGLKKIGGKIFYFETNGVMRTGFLEVKEDAYYFRKKGAVGTYGAAYTKKWVKVSGSRRYFGADGKMVKNAWAGAYYVNEDGIRLVNAITPDGYLVGSNGKKTSDKPLSTGWVKIGENYYYYKATTKTVLKNKWKTVSGVKYRLGEDGARLTGWQTIGKYRYYFNSNGAMQVGQVTVSGLTYYFNEKGRLVISSTVDGITTDENGVIVSESNIADGKKAKVLIVAGHGQGDAGATSTLGQEYLKTREFARLIYNKLAADDKVSVEYCMDGSNDYDLYKHNVSALGKLSFTGNGKKKSKVKKALGKVTDVPALWKYDYVLEVHFNATAVANKDLSGDGKAKGFGIYVNQYKSTKHRKLDTTIVANMKALKSAIWGGGVVNSAGLLNARVCNELGVNYSLIETAFIDDKDDMTFYKKNKNEMATAVAAAIESYFG